MGLFLSILYFLTYYLTPTTIFGPLAIYRMELLIAASVLLVSLPSLQGSFLLKTPQLWALIGLGVAALLSVVVGVHWVGGALPAVLLFIPNAYAYLLVCLHCNSKKKLQVLVLTLLFVCLFVIARGLIQMGSGSAPTETEAHQVNSSEDSYLMAMDNGAGAWFYRLRGQGEIHDPNDFAQLIACVVPLVFIFWRSGETLRNVLLVILPVSGLLYGVFLTHSRGSMLAFVVMAIVAARRRIGTLPALLLGAVLFVAATALHFTGGRDISVDAGEDRTALWGASMQLMKSHPLFGVGFGNLADYLGHTSHNSILVCAAELGLFGFYFWCLFLFPSVRDAIVTASPAQVSEGGPVLRKPEPSPYQVRKIEPAVDKAEINSLGRLMVLSLTGYLVTGWFLSRAFVMTLYLLGGMAEVVYQMALQRGMVAPRWPMARVMRYAGGLAVALLTVMYISLRVVNLMH